MQWVLAGSEGLGIGVLRVRVAVPAGSEGADDKRQARRTGLIRSQHGDVAHDIALQHDREGQQQRGRDGRHVQQQALRAQPCRDATPVWTLSLFQC